MLRKLFIFFENKTFSKKVNYLFRQYDFSLKNMTSCNKVNYLLRKCLNSISKISVPGQDPPRPWRWGSQLPESPGRHRVQYIDRYTRIFGPPKAGRSNKLKRLIKWKFFFKGKWNEKVGFLEIILFVFRLCFRIVGC